MGRKQGPKSEFVQMQKIVNKNEVVGPDWAI